MTTVDYFSGPLVYSHHTTRLLQRTTVEQFGWIRNINVKLRFFDIRYLDIAIDICNRRVPVGISHTPSVYDTVLTPKYMHDLTSELSAFIRAIAAREGASKLQKGDLDQLRERTRRIAGQHHR
jgi:hypothetical protein